MDKLVAFLKNVWFRRALAVVCWGYTGFMVWLAWLAFGYYFEFYNPTPLFVLYLFVNIAAMGLMILTRKQVITQVNAYILPPIVFALVIFAFGNWYMIIPPVAVMLVLFFVNSSNETLKTVLGTMFLLMYVIGVVGFIGMKMFLGEIRFSESEDGMFPIEITELDLTKRDPDYELMSESGLYRMVRYKNTSGDRKTVSYYIEYAGDDVEIPLGMCKKVFGCKHVHTTVYVSDADDPVRWGVRREGKNTVDILYIEGMVRENPYTVKELEDDEKTTQSRPSVISTRTSSSSESEPEENDSESSEDLDE